MGKMTRWAASGALLAAVATPAAAQSASASASATTTILQPLTISKSSDLGFGTIVKPTTTTVSTVTVSTAGSRTVTGGTAVAANTAGVSAAVFVVNGEGGRTFSITVPASFNMTSGANSLAVTTTKSTGATGTLSGSLGSQGSLSLAVGGSFKLSRTTPSGAYSGTFQVTVAYN
jgi:hypothetical protein